MSKIQVGSRVAYSAKFLKSIGAQTGDLAAGRGVVTKLIPLGSTTLAEIEWDEGHDLPNRVNVFNLTIVGPNLDFCAC